MIRLKPQPIHVSGMINRRLRSRERRQEQLDVLTELRQDLRREVQFEKALKAEVDGEGGKHKGRDNEKAGFEMAVTEGAKDMGAFLSDCFPRVRTCPLTHVHCTIHSLARPIHG